MTKRAVLYLRVSTTEQDVENQRSELERVCKERGWEVVETIEEEGSAYEGRREKFQRLFELAHRNKYDVLVTWSLDRLDRRGIQETLQSLQRLDDQGIQFYSYQEPYLTTLESHTRELVISMLSWVANMESRRRSERTKAGIERAREQGKKIGRPKKGSEAEREAIRKMVEQDGLSYREVERKTGVSRQTVSRIVNEKEAS
jgi:DNA invertase Pin-like site-specific DNA recombinase